LRVFLVSNLDPKIFPVVDWPNFLARRRFVILCQSVLGLENKEFVGMLFAVKYHFTYSISERTSIETSLFTSRRYAEDTMLRRESTCTMCRSIVKQKTFFDTTTGPSMTDSPYDTGK
jgi:hypothetical protein